jgi:arabinogalactan endo-1,4-beta-galactosidase
MVQYIFPCFIIFILLGFSRVLAQSTQGKSTLFTIDAGKPVAVPETGYLEMGSNDAGQSPGRSTLSVNSRYMMLDGKPWLPVMGEFHFSRYPQRYWEEEILKMKAGGIQIVSTYIFWIHHEEIEGQFDWTGQRDLRTFVELCARHGLYVYPRIGPWAHGEVRNGGFPDWLLTKCPTRVNDSTFLSHVHTFYDEIGRQLKGLLWKDGGPVIGIQIENEYGNRAPNGGEGYLLKLKSMAIEAGLDVPVYTVTGWDNAVIPNHAFVPVYGGYPDEPWSGSTRELKPDPQGVYQFHVATPVGTAGIMQGVTSAAEEVQHSHYPRFTAELGGGMEDTYHRRVVVSPDDIASMTLSALGSGVNLVGYYMYHGGANPDGKLTTLQESQATGYPNDVPVISYDFQAPLGEFGQMSGAFRKLKVLHQFIHDFGTDLDTMTAIVPDLLPSGPRDTTTLRVSARADGKSAFLFFNNYLRNYPLPEQEGVQVRLKFPSETISIPSEPINIPPQSYCYWPVNLDLDGALLKYATAQPFATLADEHDSYYFFMTSPNVDAEFVFNASTVDSLVSKSGSITRSDGRIEVRKVGPSTAEAMGVKTTGGKNVHIVVLTPEEAEDSWKLRLDGREHLLITKADVFAADDTIHLRSCDPKSFSVSIFPKLKSKLSSNVTVKRTGDDGIFTHYIASIKEENIAVYLSQIRKAGTVPPVKMGRVFDWRNGAVASSPDDSTFENAGVWRVTFPKNMPPGLSDLYLDIDYAGDVGRLYEGKRLLDDNFYNGTAWEVGLKRFGPELLSKELDLNILPLRKDAPIYIPKNKWPSFNGGMQVAEIKSVRALSEYEVTLAVGNETLAKPQGFVLGADISALDAPGRGRYARKTLTYQENGKTSDELTILSNHGWKAFRLRVFISPVRNAPDNSLENTIPLAKRIKDSGSLFLLDFHFSDTWADPQHQDIPAAWQGLSFDTLESRVEAYAGDVITQLKNAGAMPDWVQIGNEITRGTLWPLAQVQIPGSTRYNPPEPYDEAKQWDHLTRILKAGIRGVKSASGDTPPRIVIHIDQGSNWPVTEWFFDHLEAARVDYDIIGESFYPEWHHGTLEGLWNTMVQCANRYNKPFLVAETGYDSSRVKNNEDMLWPVTPEGRSQFMADLINTVRKAPHGIGVLYWAPERGAWNDDGSPAPTVFVLASLVSRTKRPQSHTPLSVNP